MTISEPVRANGVVHFGHFEFERGAAALSKAGRRVRLSKGSGLLLEALIDGRGSVVNREQLAAVLWGGDTHVDFDDGLNHAVKRLRDALGDDPKSPRIIERVPGIGYRFMAEVGDGPLAQVPRLPARNISRGVKIAVALAACLAITAFALSTRPISEREIVSTQVPVVTVLPFDDVSQSESTGLFAAGVAEALTDELSKVAGLRVTSHGSAALAKGENMSLKEIASRLGANYVVSGSVIPTAGGARVTARLTDVATDSQIWSTSFYGDPAKPLVMLDEIPRAISAAVRVRVTPEEEARLAAARPVRMDVYLKYREGRSAFESGNLDMAVKLLEETLHLDPDFAPAYSWLADAHLSLGYWAAKPDPLLKRANTAALRALQLNPTLADPHLLRGRVLSNFEWKWEEADEHFRKAIELNPNHVRAYLVYGKYLAIVGRTEEAAEMVERALELDPLSASTNGLAGEVFHASRNYPRAIDLLQTAVALHPNGVQYHVQLACIYGAAREFSRAHAHIDQAIGRTGMDLRAQAIQAWIYARSGKIEQARKLAIDIEPSLDEAHSSHYSRAFLYNALGDRDRAFEVLEQTVWSASVS